ncbi:DUF445 domain-containing protein [Nocardioides albus]|uniref:Uncharacterized membrane-anchored protein YjiN (DUF445 family) n=1 Tax=Nocardioides albus TaxID=1841 RepID=A0A7W5A2M8_9ACTN|nr:DUF445 domain-containing protein [Nocardioides albus]MBB3088562.1 uncharacterized membrane-anchored protein YjiN (DUF445 family) [Nocardioides albus]GGU17157.1 membrane protein [Nocardioides albus]
MSSPGGAGIGGLMVETEADVVRRQALRRMRIVATGLLVVAAIVYLLTLGRDGFWGFVNAGAEASMVGAIADWFAVTALFRHPLGLPVPHTALIPKRKDELGASLEEFVQDNFLQEETIRERLGVAMPSLRLALWLSEEPNAKRVVDEVSTVVADGLSRISNRHIVEIIQDGFVPRLREEQIAPLLGGTLQAALDDGVHHGLVDLALVELHGWLEENEEIVTEVLGERAPWWTPQVLREPVTARIHVELVRWIADIRDDPEHRARKAIDAMLADLADNLQHDQATMERAERLKERVLEHPGVINTAISIWDALRRALTSSLRDPEGVVRLRALDEVIRYAQKVVLDETLQRRYDALASDVAVYVVKRYGREATTVITHTIQRWDGKQAASRIELFVGRDLQFIRINGTIVGGLVGVIIHTVAVLMI